MELSDVRWLNGHALASTAPSSCMTCPVIILQVNVDGGSRRQRCARLVTQEVVAANCYGGEDCSVFCFYSNCLNPDTKEILLERRAR